MADVFISYSRKDTEFVRRLTNELTRSGRDIWVDWQDIPRGENWLNEIYRGIERADTFLFVVSRHSLKSEICNDEVHYALEKNKRIFPLIREEIVGTVFNEVAGVWIVNEWEVIARNNWEEVRRRNWIKFDDDAKFVEEFAALVISLETDQDYVREHTRYLLRALEWDRDKRNPSRLLFGDEVKAARNWLRMAHVEKKIPKPDELHRLYIDKSWWEENARAVRLEQIQRRTRQFQIAAVVLALIGIAALAAVAFATGLVTEVQAGLATARSEQDAALERVATADIQVARAQQTLTQIAPDQTHVAVNILTMTPAQETLIANSSQLNESFGVVRATLERIDNLLPRLEALELAEAADAVLTTGGDPALAALLAVRSLRDLPDEGPENILARAINRFQPIQLQVDSLFYLGGDELPDRLPRSTVVLAPDGETLITTSGLRIRIWNIFTREELSTGIGDYSSPIPVTFASRQQRNNLIALGISADGKVLITGDEMGAVRVWEVASGQLLDNALIADVNQDLFWVVTLLPPVTVVPTPTVPPFMPSSSILATVLAQARETPTIMPSIVARDIVAIGLSWNGTRAITVAPNEVKVWNIHNSTAENTFRLVQDREVGATSFSSRTGAAIMSDGDRIFAATNISLDGTYSLFARVYDVPTGRPVLSIFNGIPGFPSDPIVAVSPDDKLGAISVSANLTGIYSLETGEQITKMTGPFTAVAFNSTGEILVAARERRVALWDAKTGKSIRVLGSHRSNVDSVTFSPDGRFVVSRDRNTLIVWDLLAEPFLDHTSIPDLLNQACARIYRDFTDIERVIYEINDHKKTCDSGSSR